ncbi:hypothetical protein GPECTOR_18g90 [Gonium pectorale]|uniref:RAP domain-containing protein n=1 Tax=Gonium pectorale TaxID=33097 RepID=A0A150GJX2_GONPE|nr:hypothetical protein GPECTOR_18g90 [Gonium pectorale]|eukprot:KXZ50116.1 hypothetical protein GPECTOR_18g90 [Gonium pectorale]
MLIPYPQGLCRLSWALAALDIVPDRLWLRALAGQLPKRLRDLTPDQLLTLYCSLARLGYGPRPEVAAGLAAAARRLMPLMGSQQLAALAHAAATFERCAWAAWVVAQPGAYSWLSGAATTSGGGSEDAGALPPQLFEALTARVLHGMRDGAVDGTALSMALWAMAVLGRPPAAAAEWLSAWWAAAADPRVTPTFDATSIAQSLWAAARLQTLLAPEAVPALLPDADNSSTGAPGQGSAAACFAPPAVAMAALLARASSLLRSAATADLSTTIAALADLQYRPSDAWMTLFAAEARRRLGSPSAANEDHGLLAYGLAVLGWPLEEPWIKELAAEGYRRMPGMSGEGLGLLLWGLAQYGWTTDSNRFWDTVFSETGAKWDSCSSRSTVLLYSAVADMMPPERDPPLQWQRQLAKALRLRVPKPPSAALIPAAMRAVAGGCLGTSPLRLRGSVAAAAAAAGGLLGNGFDNDGGGGGGSALDQSLRAAAAAHEDTYGGVPGGLDGEGDEDDDVGPEYLYGDEDAYSEYETYDEVERDVGDIHDEEDGEADGALEEDEEEEEDEEGTRRVRAFWDEDDEDGTDDAALQDPHVHVLDPLNPLPLHPDQPAALPLPPEVTDPRVHPALATAAARRRVWWAHDVADELRWLWGFPGALRQLPPWVRQPSLQRLRGMMRR